MITKKLRNFLTQEFKSYFSIKEYCSPQWNFCICFKTFKGKTEGNSELPFDSYFHVRFISIENSFLHQYTFLFKNWQRFQQYYLNYHFLLGSNVYIYTYHRFKLKILMKLVHSSLHFKYNLSVFILFAAKSVWCGKMLPTIE